jgi:hypothetical protein
MSISTLLHAALREFFAVVCRVVPSAAGRAAVSLLLTLPGLNPAHATLLLTEIHYNGIASGTDPDEFLEISNTAAAARSLAGYRFSAGIDLAFSPLDSIGPRQAIVLARDADAFRGVFRDFGGTVFDYSGALSNSGETIALQDPSGAELWSVLYDDRGAWPGSADGAGDSLQLAAAPANPIDPQSWLAAPPSPGFWAGLSPATPDPAPRNPGSVSTVPAPGVTALLGAGFVTMLYRRRSRPQLPAREHGESSPRRRM